MMQRTILKYIGFILFTVSIASFAIGTWFLLLLISNNFEMGVHGVPHAICILGLFWGFIFLIISRKLIQLSRSNNEEKLHA